MPFSPASQRTSKARPSALRILRSPWSLTRSRVGSGGAPVPEIAAGAPAEAPETQSVA